MARTAKRIRFHHSRPAWQLAALLAALICLPSILLAQSPPRHTGIGDGDAQRRRADGDLVGR